MIVSEQEYKGKPILAFRRDEKDKFPVSFGVRKAKIILEHLDEIQAFYEKFKHTLKAAVVVLLLVAGFAGVSLAKKAAPKPEAPVGNWLDLRGAVFTCNDNGCAVPVTGILIGCNLQSCRPITDIIVSPGPVNRVQPAPAIPPAKK